MANPQSPFFESARRRFTFGLDWILLITLVAAATASLMGYALSLSSVRTELDAWLGKSVATGGSGSDGSSRQSQLIFLLMCYSSPMMLGLVARLIYLASVKLADKLRRDEPDDTAFRIGS